MYRRMHQYMDTRDFIEIQTPLLAHSSPEGGGEELLVCLHLGGELVADAQDSERVIQGHEVSGYLFPH